MPPNPNKNLISRKDIDIIACKRIDIKNKYLGKIIYGIRWATRPDIGTNHPYPSFPLGGFIVERKCESNHVFEKISKDNFKLPRSDNWNNFKKDVGELTRKQHLGPWFPNIEEKNLEFLLRFLRLVDPANQKNLLEKIRKKEIDSLLPIIDVANFLGNSHKDDSELKLKHWPSIPPPSLSKLFLNTAIRDDLVKFYIFNSMKFLMALSYRFEYAVLLGLATDDIIDEDKNKCIYRVSISDDRNIYRGSALTKELETNKECDPGKPENLTLTRHPGFVRHPAFKNFDNWDFPKDFIPEGYLNDANGGIEGKKRVLFSAYSPTHITKLNWKSPLNENKLLTHNAVLYEVLKYSHKKESLSKKKDELIKPPKEDFNHLIENHLFQHPGKNGLIDKHRMDWPPFEGWYSYKLFGVDLLGVRSDNYAFGNVKHFDSIAPPPPTIRMITDQSIEVPKGETSVKVEYEIIWEAHHDFDAPDCNEFRATANWISKVSVSVTILSVNSVINKITKESEPNKVSVEIDNLPGPVSRYVDTLLTTPKGVFRIVSAEIGKPGTLIVRRASGKVPTSNQDGVIQTASPKTERKRVFRKPKADSEPGFVSEITNTKPFTLKIRTLSGKKIETDTIHIYFHLFRSSFRAKRSDIDQWIVEEPIERKPDETEPVEKDPRLETLMFWRSLANKETLIEESPIIVYPYQSASIQIKVPPSFVSGMLQVDFTASDNASYVKNEESSGDEIYTGNESAPFTTMISAWSSEPPKEPELKLKQEITWANSASQFVEDSSFLLEWDAVPFAAAYEVWRCFEAGILPIGIGNSELSDQVLLGFAEDANGKAFELRDNFIFKPRYLDKLPGRSPTRVFYKLRSISEAGVPSKFSKVIGPIRIPDIRQPAPPNFISVNPPQNKKENNDSISNSNPEYIPKVKFIYDQSAEERKLELKWTQQGVLDGIKFDIETKDIVDDEWKFLLSTPISRKDTLSNSATVLKSLLIDLTPGMKRFYRLRAVRVALDPIDPTGSVTREISSSPSEIRSGHAIGKLTPPIITNVIPDLPNKKTLILWENNDSYEEIDIGLKKADGYRTHWLETIDGKQKFITILSLPDSGSNYFVLRARGYSRYTFSDEYEVKL